MHQDLQLLVELQALDSAADQARRRLADVPVAQQALDARLAARAAVVDDVKARIAVMQAARREIDKDLAAVQARLSKFKGQLMEVKTNKEYQAMQKEMATAEGDIRGHEDRLLDKMEESDALAAELKAAESALKAEQGTVAAEQKMLEGQRLEVERELARLMASRQGLTAKLSAEALKLFERVAHGRKGIAVAEARDGLCTMCRVRMRPQTFNDVRRNDGLHQCESCGRILYYVAPAPSPAG